MLNMVNKILFHK